jgi:hypothetical protein
MVVPVRRVVLTASFDARAQRRTSSWKSWKNTWPSERIAPAQLREHAGLAQPGRPAIFILGPFWGQRTSDRRASCNGSRRGCRRREGLSRGKTEGPVAKPTPHRDKWRIRWIDEHGKRQSAVFDEYKTAQRDLSRRLVEVEEVRRGIRNATPPEKTFGDLCDYWVEHRAPRKRSGKDDESIIRRHLRPAFGAMRLRDVGVEEVDAYVNGKIDDEELSDKTVSNHVTLLATMLRLATTFKVPWLAHAPRFRKPKVSRFSRDFQWLRTDDEIGRFLRAARDEVEIGGHRRVLSSFGSPLDLLHQGVEQLVVPPLGLLPDVLPWPLRVVLLVLARPEIALRGLVDLLAHGGSVHGARRNSVPRARTTSLKSSFAPSSRTPASYAPLSAAMPRGA